MLKLSFTIWFQKLKVISTPKHDFHGTCHMRNCWNNTVVKPRFTWNLLPLELQMFEHTCGAQADSAIYYLLWNMLGETFPQLTSDFTQWELLENLLRECSRRNSMKGRGGYRSVTLSYGEKGLKRYANSMRKVPCPQLCETALWRRRRPSSIWSQNWWKRNGGPTGNVPYIQLCKTALWGREIFPLKLPFTKLQTLQCTCGA